MHNLFAKVLTKKDLSRAGDLFSLDDKDIEGDLSEVLLKIRDIANAPDYLQNDNDQSVVEICTTRVTSAIRETGSIEKHAHALVALLDACLRHNLKPTSKDEDPPHAKIASDILSCVFLNYGKKSVMELALPIAVRFLYHGNRELSRNMSSYLSLAAIDNSKLLANHMQAILDSILSGNKTLSRVLPQIYNDNKEPVHRLVAQLVTLLPDCEPAEKNSLLQLFGLVVHNQPRLLESQVSQLCAHLSSTSTAMTILQAFVEMSSHNPVPFVKHSAQLKVVVEQQPATLGLIAKVLGAVGRTSENEADTMMSYLTSQLGNADHHTMPIILSEIQSLATVYPRVLPNHVEEINKFYVVASVASQYIIQQLRELYEKGVSNNPGRRSAFSQTEGTVTVITVGNPSANRNPSHLTNHYSPPISNFPNSKNASTSTREISFPGMAAHSSGFTFPNSMSSIATSAVTGSNVTMHVSTNSNGLPILTAHPAGRKGSGHIGPLNERAMSITSSHINSHHGSQHVGSSHALPYVPPSLHGSQVGSHYALPYVPSNHGSQHISSHLPIVLQGSQLGSQNTLPYGASNREIPHSSQHTLPYGASNHTCRDTSQQTLPRYSAASHATQPVSSHHTLPHVSSSHGSQIASSQHTLGSHHMLPVGSHHGLHHAHTSHQGSHAGLPYGGIHTPHSAPGRVTPFEERSLLGTYTQALTHTAPTVTNTYTGQPHAIPFRDAVQHFCEKHLTKIKAYINNVTARLPLPIKATLHESKQKRSCKLHFICLGQGPHCIYSHNFFTFRTKNARTWVHLMFLALQARSEKAVSQQDPSVGNLKSCWDSYKMNSGNSFVRLVTSSFPSTKDQDTLLQELHGVRYFDVFEFNAAEKHWACFLCNHPEKAMGLLQDGDPVIEGQLKEKKGRWKFFKRWKTRYFTLSGATITFSKKDARKETLSISTIQTVKAVRKGMRDIPRAFEIFTNNQKYIFKVKEGRNAEQWVQCLQIAVARSQKGDEEIPSFDSCLPSRANSRPQSVTSSQTKL